MKNAMIILGVFVIIASSIMIGCRKVDGEKSKENGKGKVIVGKWEEVDGTQTIKFFKEGTVVVIDKGDPPLTGDYRFIGDSRIRMDLKGLGELLGPVIAKISISMDEIVLTNPSGKIEKYRKLEQIGRATKSNIAGNYTIVMKMPDGEEFKNPALITLKEDGTGLVSSSGKWNISGDQLEFQYDQDVTGVGGEITMDALRRKPPQVSLRKRRKAEVIKRIKTGSILWSEYYFTGDRSSIIKSINLEIKEHGTFQELFVRRDVWRIKDGGVEITVADENQKERKIKGEIEENTIIFQDGETEFRYIKVENAP